MLSPNPGNTWRLLSRENHDRFWAVTVGAAGMMMSYDVSFKQAFLNEIRAGLSHPCLFLSYC